MRAITLTQPWAGLVASGIKLVENRPRAMGADKMIGERIAIHASREVDAAVFERIYQLSPELHPRLADTEEKTRWHRLARITSAIIAVATIDQVVAWQADAPALRTAADVRTGAIVPLAGDQRRWFFGPIGIILRDVVAIEPITKVRGALGFWRVADDVAARVAA